MFRSRCGALPLRLPTTLCTYPSLHPSQLRSTYPSRSWGPPSTVATTGTVRAAATTVLLNSQRRQRTASWRPRPRGMFETLGHSSVSTHSTSIKSLRILSAASAEARTQRRRARRPSRSSRLSVCAAASRSSSPSSPAAWSSFGALSASAWRCVWRPASRVSHPGYCPLSRVLPNWRAT